MVLETKLVNSGDQTGKLLCHFVLLWLLQAFCRFNTGYTEALTLKGHKSYVSSVCCLPPSAEYANGLLISGGNDSNICIYTLDNPKPFITLKGHTNTGNSLNILSIK